jgi:hypothetical protein
MCKDADPKESSFEFGIGDGDTITLLDNAGTVLSTTTLDPSQDGQIDKLWIYFEGEDGQDPHWEYVGGFDSELCMNGIVDLGEDCDPGVVRPNERCLANCKWNTAAQFYDPATVPTVTINIATEDYEHLALCTRNEYMVLAPAPECDYHEALCTITYKSTGFESGVEEEHNLVDVPCEVRRKGSASWREMGSKPALKVKLKQSWRGIRKLTFNNMAQVSSRLLP